MIVLDRRRHAMHVITIVARPYLGPSILLDCRQSEHGVHNHPVANRRDACRHLEFSSDR